MAFREAREQGITRPSRALILGIPGLIGVLLRALGFTGSVLIPVGLEACA